MPHFPRPPIDEIRYICSSFIYYLFTFIFYFLCYFALVLAREEKKE